ncbi:MAG: FMN-binding negative transcriptional regulator [Pseudomonadota bacterium]|nr:FMN-binding negative transcriptional regulator [Pseudomonadota bacterium]
MHPNLAFVWQDRDEMLAFVARVAFSTIFFSAEGGLRVVHVPVTVEAPDRLRFHLARSNRAASGLDGSQVLLSCLGPDAYISPDWYGTPDQVPTWNYVAVECEGTARRLSEDDLVAQLDRLSAAHESRLVPKAPWTRDKMTPGRFEAMTRAIACFEIEVGELRGTRKLGQNKKPAEREGALGGLAAAGRPDMAELMRREFAGR